MTRSSDAETMCELTGGIANGGRVFRIGDTVRRPLRPTSPATEALLRHLHDVGFDGAPRYLGIDRNGREMLSFIPGAAVIRPYPEWALTDAALSSVADLLRRYHEAVSGFVATGLSWPRAVPAAFRDGLVSHNDLNLDNIVFRDGRAVALIDFDLAGPGSRLWDVASAARLWSPLRPDETIDDARRGHALRRLSLFVDRYGLDDAERARVADAVMANHDWSYDIIEDAVEHGHPGFSDYLRGGAGERAARTRRWYRETTQLADALAR